MKTNVKFWVILIFILAMISFFVQAADVEITFLNQEPDPVEPGEYVEIRYKIENLRSEDIYDVKVELEQEYPFIFDTKEDRVKIIPKLSHEFEGKKAINIKFRARISEDAVEGDYKVRLLVSSSSYRGVSVQEKQISIKSREMIVVVDSVNINPDNPGPGETTAVSLNLKNLAYSALYDVRVRLGLEDASLSPIGSTDEKVLDKIDPREEKAVTFSLAVDADAESRIHKIPLLLEFKDKFGEVHKLSSTFGIRVNAAPEYVINLEDSDVYVTKHSGEVVISVSNTGVGDINFMLMELLPSKYYEVISNPKVYLGNLESDDYETAGYSVYTKKSTDGYIPLEVKLSFKDSYNRDYEDLVEIPLKMYSRREASKIGLIKSRSIVKPLIILILLGIAGYFGYRRWKSGKKRK